MESPLSDTVDLTYRTLSTGYLVPLKQVMRLAAVCAALPALQLALARALVLRERTCRDLLRLQQASMFSMQKQETSSRHVKFNAVYIDMQYCTNIPLNIISRCNRHAGSLYRHPRGWLSI